MGDKSISCELKTWNKAEVELCKCEHNKIPATFKPFMTGLAYNFAKVEFFYIHHSNTFRVSRRSVMNTELHVLLKK